MSNLVGIFWKFEPLEDGTLTVTIKVKDVKDLEAEMQKCLPLYRKQVQIDLRQEGPLADPAMQEMLQDAKDGLDKLRQVVATLESMATPHVATIPPEIVDAACGMKLMQPEDEID